MQNAKCKIKVSPLAMNKKAFPESLHQTPFGPPPFSQGRQDGEGGKIFDFDG
jgi:hypothetical protein